MRELDIHDQINRIISAGLASAKENGARSYIECMEFHFEGYAETGYSDPESGVICTGNYNSVNEWIKGKGYVGKEDDAPCRVARLLEKIGVELEWEDEWDYCGNCYKLIRTQPDSYCWTRSYWFDESYGECTCHECVKEDPEYYLEYLEGDPSKALTIDVDLEAHGYRKIGSEFESGFHEGQDDDPKVIAEALETLGASRFIFEIESVGQFDARFGVWVHEDDIKEFDWDAWEAAEKTGYSPSKAMKSALKGASAQMSKREPGTVQVIKCNPDGSADVKNVSQQDFIDGKALD